MLKILCLRMTFKANESLIISWGIASRSRIIVCDAYKQRKTNTSLEMPNIKLHDEEV